MIRYSWAKYNGKPIHISEVNHQMRKDGYFYNILTNERMVAYLSGKFQKHFHHWNKDKSHNYETYLHETAKFVLQETYFDCIKNNKPFILEYFEKNECRNNYLLTGVICNKGDVLAQFDLTTKFNKLKLEKVHNGFFPDVQIISNNNDVIYFEIYVTHKSEQSKISSGNRIVEIKINNETDILNIKKAKISVNDNNTTFYNFKKNKKIVDYCSDSNKGCRTYCEAFFQYKNGSYEFIEDSLENILSHSIVEEDRILKVDFQTGASNEIMKEYYIENLIEQNAKIKDCRFCKYVAVKQKKQILLCHFCKFLKKNVEYDTAFQCEYFRKN